MNFELSVAIVTKRRPQMLARCLDSFCIQTQLPKQILIIDNDSGKSAFSVFQKYVKRLPVRYLQEKRSGVPYARNKALIAAGTKYLGFIDDDCILSNNWVEQAITVTKNNKGAAYVCGKTNLYNNKNIWAVGQYSHDRYWFIKKIKKNEQTTSANFDTKNVVLNKDLILRKNLKFDTKCGIKGFDSADYDFGLQLSHKKFKGVYFDKMILTHEETSNFKRYVTRAYYRGIIAGYLEKKWRFDNKFVDFPERNILIWLFRKLKMIPSDFKRYTNYLKAPTYFKTLVVIAIIIYEGAYLKGYLDFKT